MVVYVGFREKTTESCLDHRNCLFFQDPDTEFSGDVVRKDPQKKLDCKELLYPPVRFSGIYSSTNTREETFTLHLPDRFPLFFHKDVSDFRSELISLTAKRVLIWDNTICGHK